MPLQTSPSGPNLKQKNFTAQEHGVDLNATLEGWSGVPGPQAEAAGIAAHEAAELRVARKRQAAWTAAQARREHRRAVRMQWAAAWPMEVRTAADLPLATMALGGLLVARSNARGVARLSLREMQGRLAAGSHHTVVDGATRLEALGWIAVERRRIGRDLNALNVYRLRHPALIEAARQAKGGGSLDRSPSLPESPNAPECAGSRALHQEGGGVRQSTAPLLRRIKRKYIQTYKGRREAAPVCTRKQAERQERRGTGRLLADGTTGGPSSARRTNDEKRRTAAPCPSSSAPRPF